MNTRNGMLFFVYSSLLYFRVYYPYKYNLTNNYAEVDIWGHGHTSPALHKLYHKMALRILPTGQKTEKAAAMRDCWTNKMNCAY